MQEGNVHPPSWHLVIKNAEIPTLFFTWKTNSFSNNCSSGSDVVKYCRWRAPAGSEPSAQRAHPLQPPHGGLGVSSRGRWPKAGPVRAGPPRHCTAQLPAPPQRAQGCFKSCLLNGERGRAPLTALLHPGGLPLWRHHSAEQLWAEGRPISTAFYPCQTHKHSNEPNWF